MGTKINRTVVVNGEKKWGVLTNLWLFLELTHSSA